MCIEAGRAIALAIAALSVAFSCTTALAQDDGEARIRLMGFSVALPADLGWQPLRRQAFEITLARNTTAQGPSYAANASLIGVPLSAAGDAALLEFVKTMRAQNIDRARFRVVRDEEAISKERDEVCVRYHSEVEDHGQARGNGAVFALDIVGLVCLHPQDPNLGVDFNFATRTPLSAKPEGGTDESQVFLRAVRFERLSAGEVSTALYDAGLNLRHRGEFGQAEILLKRALETQEKLSGADSEASGRRMAELAAVLLVQGKLEEGTALVKRLLPLSDGYSASERRFLAKLFGAYAEEIAKADSGADVSALVAKAKALDDQ